MPDLVALARPGGPGFVEALERIWDAGHAALPLDARLPPAARAATITAMAPAVLVDERGEQRLDGGRPVEPGDALVVVTSGTTGVPKGVVLTHDAVRASALATSRRLQLGDADRWLACLPLSHVGGLSVVTRALVTGTPIIVQPGFEAAAVEAAAREHGATLVSLVSTALSRIDPTLFRVIVLGGARPPEHRPPNTVATYGLTETGSGIVYDGVPLEGVEVRVDGDGEIAVRGPMLLRAYRDGTDPKDSAGWFRTGDVGALDADGGLVVQGRRGDLIITGGENVWPEPVEARLSAHPDVVDVAVAGVDDPEWGERVVAYLVPRRRSEPPQLDALREWVKEALPAYCAPRELVLIDAVPRTAIGKPRRELLSRPPGQPIPPRTPAPPSMT